MHRLIFTVIALSIVFASLAWAGDRHEESLTGQHVSADQDTGGSPSDGAGSCEHCCHASSHYLALRDGDLAIPSVHVGFVRPVNFLQPPTWSSGPPTPPPSS